VLLNVSLDHKSMDELRLLFRGFLEASALRAVSADDSEAIALAEGLGDLVTFAIDEQEADLTVEPGTILDESDASGAVVLDRRDRTVHTLKLAMPGRHNLANAMAAIAGASAAGVPVADAVHALWTFAGLARRFDVIGVTPAGMTVIDDFGHNPEKCAATLRTLKAHPGRVIAVFQPHGYGPLRQMGRELAATFARELGPDDRVFVSDPVYMGGTVDRSEGSDALVRMIAEAGGVAEHIATREQIADRVIALARPGDRIVVMGARDDTLSAYARDLFARLG
jgi:UDP-N-acetylmuramate--alanine ligase